MNRSNRGPCLIASVFAFAMTGFVDSSAWAEVCDKVASENWYPEHGPILILPFGGFPMLKGPVVAMVLILSVVAAGLALARSVGSVAACIAGGVCLTFGIGMVLLGLIGVEDDIVIRAAINEGCWTTSTTGGIEAPLTMFAAAAMCFWIHSRTRNQKGTA
jgi:hypothetical protein